MNPVLQTTFSLLGGLALFLFGMNQMSDSLQKAAGDRMRRILGALTRNPVSGVLAGALVTALIQSSSATTVMVIGFTSAGLMTLPQAISVIFGANIGTTMTAQIIAFNLSDWIYPILFIGFLLYFLSKREVTKQTGMILLSFGLLFLGIETMGDAMKPIAGSAVFTDFMTRVKNIPVLGVILGLMMTLVVQSSSATIAVLQNFASQPGPDGISSIIGLSGAIPILFGDNIGTTITAVLAAIGQSLNARRAAAAHCLFNISGTIVFLCCMPLLTGLVELISPKGPELEIISRQIANAHTLFNCGTTLLWIPLLPVMVYLVMRLLPEAKKEKTFGDALYLDPKMLAYPASALALLTRELQRLVPACRDMLGRVRSMVCSREGVTPENTLSDMREGVKNLEHHIASYAGQLLSGGRLTERQTDKVTGILFVANHLEKMSDRCEEIEQAVQKNGEEKKIRFSDAALTELGELTDTVLVLYAQATAILDTDSFIPEEMRRAVRNKQKMLTKAHMLRVKEGDCALGLTKDYTRLLDRIDLLADACIAIAEDAKNLHR